MNAHLIIDATAFATLVLVAAFFVLAIAERSLGFANIFGKLLAFWLVIVALVAVAGALTAKRYGGKWFGMDLPWHEQGGQPQPAAPPPADAQPAPETAPAEEQPSPNFTQPAPSGG